MQTFLSILRDKNSKRVFTAAWTFTTSLSMVLYGFFRLLFIDFNITAREDLYNLFSLLGIASLISICFLLAYLLIEIIDNRMQHPFKWKWNYVSVPIVAILVALMFASCGNSPVAGFKKNMNTGMVTNYKGLAPESAMLVMNKEEINHTDIPLGEEFVLMNNGVKGFTLENNKAKIGCSLKISDKKGQVLLNEQDLFKGHDSFSPEDAANLRCTITTGAPMKSEEFYDVVVVFKDKLGEGNIENKFTIRAIDMP